MKPYIILLFICFASSLFASPFWLLEQANCTIAEKEVIYSQSQSLQSNWSAKKALDFLNTTQNHKDINIRIYGLFYIGKIYYYNDDFDNATYYIEELKSQKKSIQSPLSSQIGLFLEGKLLSVKNNLAEGASIFLDLINEESTNPYLKCLAYQELGFIANINKDKKLISKYYGQAIEIANELENLHLILKCEVDLLFVSDIKMKGVEKYQLLQNQATTYSWEKRVQNYLTILSLRENATEYKQLGNYDAAIQTNLKIIELKIKTSSSLKYSADKSRYEYTEIADCYFHKKDYHTALKYLNKLTIIHKYEYHDSTIRNFIITKINVYRALKNYEQVAYYQEILIKNQKESFDKEKQEALAKYNQEFETAEKEKLIHDQDLLIAQQTRKNQFYIYLFAFGTLLLGSLLYNYKRNQKIARKELEFSQKAIKLERDQNAELQKLEDYRSHLFASLSHEFKTPLTLLKTPLEEMSNNTFSGDYAHYYDLMLRNTNRLLDLVNQMLTLSKLKHGKVNINLQKWNINHVIQNIFIQFEGIAIKKKLKLELYAPSKDLVLDIDKDFLEKIVGNLIQNSIKYTNTGGSVFVQSSTTDTHFKLTVIDTGEGIDEESLEHIFEAFYREKAYQLQQKDGVGLGLSIVKELTDLLDGKIDIRSKKNKGTTISILLPLVDSSTNDLLNQNFLAQPVKTIQFFSVDPNQNGAILSSNLQNHINIDDSKPTLLVLEDNGDLQQLINDQLAKDFQIMSAFNGLEGLSILETIQPDLIISDIMMPKMDGIQFVKKVQSDIRLSHIPILLLSALDAEKAEREGFEAGAIDFLEKPINFTNLQLQLHNLLKIQQQRQQDVSQYIISDLKSEGPSKLVNIDKQFIIDLKKSILDNIHNNNFSVELLSKKMNLSRSTLFLKIKKLTGVSISSFIRKFRLARAKTFLEQRQGNVSEAAYSVGIYNLSYFTRIFKEEFGITPREIINQHKDKVSE